MITINNLFNTDIYINDKKYKIDCIEIPEIQRDYIQGLEEYSNKLDKFLDVLFKALNALSLENKCSLDFIYGNIENDIFKPIDGQQRLTTLALLYYYIETIYKKNNDNIFTKITYKTKNTATEFCELLSSDDFVSYLRDNINNKIDNVIKDYHEYYDIYDYDLTIKSIINTLKSVQEKYDKLNDKNNISFDNITFQIFPMESFNLSDDLYIKMNGRGKQLSSFDNFKADYFKWLEEKTDNNDNNIDKLIPNSIVSDEDNNKYKEEGKEKERKKHKLETLKRKFDTDYIDIFWDYALKNSEDTDETPDPEKLFFRFINRFVVGKYLLLTDTQKNNIKNDFEKTFFDDGIKSEKDAVVFNDIELYKSILNEQDNDKKYTYNYKIINILENLYNLQKCCSSNFKDILNFIFNPLWEVREDEKLWEVREDEKLNIFPKENGLTYKHVLIFNAITSFLEQDSIIIDNIKCDVYNKIKEIFKNENNLSIHEECENNILMTLKRISRIVWNITEQYNLLHTISKNNYKTVISRLDFSKLDKTDNVYDKFVNIYKIREIKKLNNDEQDNIDIDIIIEDEVNKCQYLYDDNKVDMSLEQKFINLERLPYLKGTIGFLLGNDKNNFVTIYKSALSIFDKYVFDKYEKTNDNNKKYFIDNTNNYFFNRYILYKYFLENKLDIKKYNEKLFTLDALKVQLINNEIIQKLAYEFVNELQKYTDNSNNSIIPNIEELEKDINPANIYEDALSNSIVMLLYYTQNNTYLLNKYYILSRFLPCIIHINYHNKDFRVNKRLNSKFGQKDITSFFNTLLILCTNSNNIELHTNIKIEKVYSQSNDEINLIYNIVAEAHNEDIRIYLSIHKKPYTLYINQNSIGFQCEDKSIYHYLNSINDFTYASKAILEIINRIATENILFQNIAKEYCKENKFKPYNL